jgi:hypothetical protein
LGGKEEKRERERETQEKRMILTDVSLVFFFFSLVFLEAGTPQ